MKKATSILIFMSINFCLTYAQTKYKSEIGIGSILTPLQRNMELSFSFQVCDKNNRGYKRFRTELGLPHNWNQGEEVIQFYENQIMATNVFRRDSKLLVKYGKGKVKQLGWGEYYYGVDANLGWSYLNNKHYYSKIPYIPDDPNNMYEYTSINQNILLGITPVSGLKIYLFKHFILSIEAGLELNYQYTRLPIFDGEHITHIHRHNFETSWPIRYILNDIMISYRF